MQRRINQTNRHRAPVHCGKHTEEIALLQWNKRLIGFLTLTITFGKNHFFDQLTAIAKEHMLRAAQTNPLRPKISRALSILRVISICTHLQLCFLVCTAQNVMHSRHQFGHVFICRSSFDSSIISFGNIGHHCRICDRNFPFENFTSRAIDSDHVTSFIGGIFALHIHSACHLINHEVFCTHHAATPHAARHHSCMRGLAAASRKHTSSHNHALKIIRVRLTANQNNWHTSIRASHSLLVIHHNLTHSSARRSRHTFGNELLFSFLIKLREE
ncbi:Uncharacterised protein [Chlamydia trachomatis]|nr:Uncharacterised protein [Chlamydia trachomatis]